MKQEILDAIRERGLLLEKGVFDVVNSFSDINVAKDFLRELEVSSGQKIINTSVLSKNVELFRKIVGSLPGTDKNYVENVFIKLGVNLEIKRESQVVNETAKAEVVAGKQGETSYQVFYAETRPDKKIEVADFVGNFRARYQTIQRILMQRSELKNLVSINKISGDRQSLSVIGIVKEKRATKNKNLILRIEDLTGEISVLVKADNENVYAIAEEVIVDDIIAIRGSGSRDFLFAYDIFYPDAFKLEKAKFESDINVAFISDIHCGSRKHCGKEFERFLDWLNSESEIAKKIRYLFIIGDNIEGIGVFPGQEEFLELKTLKEQYGRLADYFRRVPKHITMFMLPGQHDAVRVAEPQPLISKRYAPQLYDIENLVLVTNPAMIKLIEKDREFKVLMYHGGSIHAFINEVKELRMMKAHKTPARAIKHMLKRRHLAPMYGVNPSVVCVPNIDKDPLVIYEVPDILCCGEVHRIDVETYNGILMLTGGCWQTATAFEEKVGNLPDPAKVPIFNLKSRELKIMDFNDEKKEDAVGESNEHK